MKLVLNLRRFCILLSCCFAFFFLDVFFYYRRRRRRRRRKKKKKEAKEKIPHSSTSLLDLLRKLNIKSGNQ